MNFLVKVILIDFQLEKYMQSKEKDVYNFFSCIINVTVTSQNGVPSFHLHQRAYMWWGYLHKLNSLIFMFVALKLPKTSIETLK